MQVISKYMELNKELYLKACERLRKHNMQVATHLEADKKHCNFCGWDSEETEVYCPMCGKKKVK